MFPLLGIASLEIHPLVLLAFTVFAAIGAVALGEGIGKWLFPAKPPKPEKFTLNILNKDGYPLRSYSLAEEKMNRIDNGIHAEYDTKPKPKA